VRGIVCFLSWACALPPSFATAGEIWSWHEFELIPVHTSRVEWTLHTRLRTQLGGFQQGRTGTILNVTLHPRVGAIGGYYYGKEEDSLDEFRNFHRLFTGVEIPLYESRRTSVITRALVEQFIRSAEPDFTRYRHRVRVGIGERLGPYMQGEWFFDGEGFLSARYSAGVHWRQSRWAMLEAGYLYDRRRRAIGPARHALVTTFIIEPGRTEK
jgi:hypothetical protein